MPKNIYICGPTVYSRIHVGNLKPMITFDIFIRSLRYLKEQVNVIHNITDIDDKIIDAAAKEGKTEAEITANYSKHYLALLEALNIQEPNEIPFVTKNINVIINFIERLINLGNAYHIDGNVYFDVQSIGSYGQLSNRKLEDLIFEGGSNKRHPADFSLWKKTSQGIQFDSPWGKGRPGWHTECAAFIDKLVNREQLDIHGGGIDLLFPHHENENIQYLAANKHPITAEWKHLGQLNYNDQKMSKSIGNIIDGEEFIKTHGIDILRTIFLTSSITGPINITNELIENAKIIKDKYCKAYKMALAQVISLKENEQLGQEFSQLIANWEWAEAVKKLNSIVKQANIKPNNENYNNVITLMGILGFVFTTFELSEEDKQMLRDWKNLRKKAKFEEADSLRMKLQKKGLI